MHPEVRKHLSAAGKKGRKAIEKKYGKRTLREWAKRGGRPRKKPVDNSAL